MGEAQTVVPSGALWLILFFPLLGAVVNGLCGKWIQNRIGPRAVHTVAIGAMVMSAATSIGAVARLAALPPSDRFVLNRLWELLIVADLRVDVAFALDPLSAVMVLIITLVGTVIHVYATGYMRGDPSVWRFFSYMNLFVFSMLLLVLADSLFLLFFGWEGVGLCSYLLIGFWYRDLAKAKAGMKAFITNRVGDWGFLMGMILLFWGMGGTWIGGRYEPDVGAGRTITLATATGDADEAAPDQTTAVRLGPTLTFRELEDQLALRSPDGARVVAARLAEKSLWGVPLLLLVGVALFLGVAGKSAQIPLYVWLPDAMAGPTPVSALIHAATMVTAGVYLLARLSFLFALTPETLTLVAAVGVGTAFLGALLATFQYDIKKVLAYSTVSQIGFMILAAGVGAHWVAIFHLLTHACFKACLFLSAGSVIHGMHGAAGRTEHGTPPDLRLEAAPGDPQDLRNMGGLASLMPKTRLAYLLGCLSIAGFPIAAGFYSKDEIVLKAFTQQNVLLPGWLLGSVALATAALTTFYMFRSYYLAFWARSPSPALAARVHESPQSMTAALTILGAAAVVTGPVFGWPEAWGGHPWLERFLAPVFSAAAPLARFDAGGRAAPYLVQIASVLLAFFGWALARRLYRDLERTGERLARWRQLLDRPHRAFFRGLYVDDAYRELAVYPAIDIANGCAWVDRNLVDRLVNLSSTAGRTVATAGGWLDRRIIDGAVNGISAVMISGGRRLARLQTGRINHYVLGITLGVMLLVFLSWMAS